MRFTNEVNVDRFWPQLEKTNAVMEYGIVEKVVANTIESHGPNVTVGSLCWLWQGTRRVPLEVVGITDGRVISMPLAKIDGVRQGDIIESSSFAATLGVNEHLQGRILDGLGRPLDESPLPQALTRQDLYSEPANPL